MYRQISSSGFVNSKFYDYTLSSGAKCYIIPRNGFKTFQACVLVDYGAEDIAFSSGNGMFLSPCGTAHFIEHRLFEKKNESFFSQFAKAGAISNAFTDYTRTAYYFSCTDGFYENLNRLLKMVSEPYFDDCGVQSEREIIKREIAMCSDMPHWRAYCNMFKALYRKKALKTNIAGTENSVDNITPEILYKCYNCFYTAANISVICVGNIDGEKAADAVERTNFSTAAPAVKYYPSDEKRRGGDYIKERMNIKEPVFSLGFDYHGLSMSLKKLYALRLAFELVAGEGSVLYSKLFMQGMLFEPLGWSVSYSKDHCTGIVSGKSGRAISISNMVIDEADAMLSKGISVRDFNRAKKALFGRFLRGFNSIDALCMAQADLSYFKADLAQAEETIAALEYDDIKEALEIAFSRQSAVLSTVE